MIYFYPLGMTTLGERLHALRAQRGLSLRALGEAAGVSATTVHNWERGVTSKEGIGRFDLDRAAAALKTTVEYLLEGKGVPQIATVKVQAYDVETHDDDTFDPTTGVMLPIYDMDVSAGPGRIVPEFAETRYKLHFTRQWLKGVDAKEQDIKITRVRGDSMQPTVYDGDAVAIHTGKTRIRDGKVFALAYAGEARIKRLYNMAGGKVRVVSDNPDKARYPDEVVEGDALNEVLIIGQIVHKMGNGGL